MVLSVRVPLGLVQLSAIVLALTTVATRPVGAAGRPRVVVPTHELEGPSPAEFDAVTSKL